MTDKPFVDRLLAVIEELAEGNKKKFAEMLGISPVNIQDWVNQGHYPKTPHLANLQQKLNININWLLTGEGPRYIKKYDVGAHGHAPLLEAPAPYGFANDEERDYIKKLLKILRTKQDKTVIAIKQNIDAFLDTPNKEKAKKSVSNG